MPWGPLVSRPALGKPGVRDEGGGAIQGGTAPASRPKSAVCSVTQNEEVHACSDVSSTTPCMRTVGGQVYCRLVLAPFERRIFGMGGANGPVHAGLVGEPTLNVRSVDI